LPNGTTEGGINEEGVRFYRELLGELKQHRIEPHITLYHWCATLSIFGGFIA
jgi:beta-glucosidase